MRVFWHINEFEYDALDILPFALFFSDEMVLWAPAAKRINHAAQQAGLNFNARSLLKHVESGAIRIAAREKWIMEPQWRNDQAWEQGHWDAEFDEEVRRIAHADRGMVDARVIVCENDDYGYAYADQELDRSRSPAAAVARTLYEHHKERIPLGTRERAERKSEAGHRSKARVWIREILRDAYNHEWARTCAGKADIPIETAEFPPEYALIGKREAFEARFEPVNLKRVLELTEICYELNQKAASDTGTAPSLDDIVALKREHRPEAEMQKFLCARFGRPYEENEVTSQLIEDLQAADKALGGAMEFIFGEGWRGYVNAGGATTAVIGAVCAEFSRREFITRVGAIAGVIGLSAAGLVTGANTAEWYSVKELSSYKGPRWPFLLRYGRS